MMILLRILALIILASIHHINPRPMGAANQPKPVQQNIQPTPPQNIPIQKPSPQIPQARVQQLQPKPAPIQVKSPAPAEFKIPEKSYQDMITYIKNTRNVWDNKRSVFNTDFINTVLQKSRILKLDTMQQEALLQTARDIHIPFSGNKNKDIAILQSVENQIAAAIKQK